MPTVLRYKGYRIFFSGMDWGEPPHVHVQNERGHAKVWLETLACAYSRNLRDHELAEIRRILGENMDMILEKWHDFFHR